MAADNGTRRIIVYTVSDIVIDRLIEWDLHRFYGYPGDGLGGFDGALGRAEKDGNTSATSAPRTKKCAR